MIRPSADLRAARGLGLLANYSASCTHRCNSRKPILNKHRLLRLARDPPLIILPRTRAPSNYRTSSNPLGSEMFILPVRLLIYARAKRRTLWSYSI